MVCKILNIDFNKFGGPTYIGRDKGEAVRSMFKLDQLDQLDQLEERDESFSVCVIIPSNTYNRRSAPNLVFINL